MATSITIFLLSRRSQTFINRLKRLRAMDVGVCGFGYKGYIRNSVLRVPGIQMLCVIKEKPTAQTAHLVFADTKSYAKKPKELFLANA